MTVQQLVEQWRERGRQHADEFHEQVEHGDNMRAIYVDGKAEAFRLCADELSAATAAEDWQPMETAPKDGTPILGAMSGGRIDVFQWESQSGNRRPNPYWMRWFHPAHHDRSNQPTHWKPLPAAPVSGQANPVQE